MRIERILNNNAVIIYDSQGNEQVVCGKGIAYKKAVGEEVDEEEINRIFILKDRGQDQKFQQLLNEIPLEHIQVATQIIEMIKTESRKTINDSIYISLSDHIYTSIVRFLDGVIVRNGMLWEIKRFYENEFKLGEKALDMIEANFNIRLPVDEAGFIALHIVNAQMDESSVERVVEITRIIQEISNLVKYYFTIDFDTESVYYYRFITHLKFFAQRLILGKPTENLGDDELLNVVKLKYQTSYRCSEKIGDFIKRKYNYSITDEEMLYLTIHIETVVYRSKK